MFMYRGCKKGANWPLSYLDFVFLLLFGYALFEPVAIAVHLKDINVMC